MNPSPLTFKDLKFLRVRVDADLSVKNPSADFDFDGCLLGWSVNHGRETQDNAWWVAVGFASSNKNAEKLCPYEIDVQAVGVFEVSSAIAEENREKLVYENGAALVYGAIRDMVSTISSRSLPGSLMLPTPTFMGAFEERQANATTPIQP